MADEGPPVIANTVQEDDRKLFVGALPQEVKDMDIKEYFDTFGEIENINLKMDIITGKSRGFAFIVFKTLAGIEAVLKQTPHVVKGKKVTCKKAESRQGKIYVGKLPTGEVPTKEDLQAHFEQFGSVVEVVRPVDKLKNDEPKTFAFITFAREDTAKQLIKQGQTTINGDVVEIKKVTHKEQIGGAGWGGPGWCEVIGGGFEDLYDYSAYGSFLKLFTEPWSTEDVWGAGGKRIGFLQGAPGGSRGRGGRPY